MIIYKLTFPNGKSYIGQTVRKMETRLSQHRTQARANNPLPVYCAWRKHGEPSVVVLSEHDTMESLHAAEVSSIASCGSISPFGYNISVGGDTAPSKNPIVAAKISAKAKGRVTSEKTKAKLALSSAANWNDPIYREKVTAGVRASFTPERRARMSEIGKTRVGWNMSEAAKDKLRGRVFSDETRAKMSAAAKARKRAPWSEETRAKMAEGARKAHAASVDNKRGDAIKAAHAARSPEERSEAARKAWATKRAKGITQ